MMVNCCKHYGGGCFEQLYTFKSILLCFQLPSPPTGIMGRTIVHYLLHLSVHAGYSLGPFSWWPCTQVQQHQCMVVAKAPCCNIFILVLLALFCFSFCNPFIKLGSCCMCRVSLSCQWIPVGQLEIVTTALPYTEGASSPFSEWQKHLYNLGQTKYQYNNYYFYGLELLPASWESFLLA